MNRKIFISLIIVLSILSCEKEKCQPCENLVDIQGSWISLSGHTITFYKNGEYKSIVNLDIDRNPDSISSIIKGNYRIRNGYLELSNLKYSYLKDMSGIFYLTFVYPTYSYEIKNDSLLFTETGIFYPVGHSGFELNGKWVSNRIIIAYDTRQTPNFITGNQTIHFDFSENTQEYYIYNNNEYGEINDSLVDGPYKYLFENQVIYSESFKEPFGLLAAGKLITQPPSGNTYTRIK